MKEKDTIGLCMRYSESCKLCPRNKKCEEELREEAIKRRRGDKSESKRVRNNVRNNKRRKHERISKTKKL